MLSSSSNNKLKMHSGLLKEKLKRLLKFSYKELLTASHKQKKSQLNQSEQWKAQCHLLSILKFDLICLSKFYIISKINISFNSGFVKRDSRNNLSLFSCLSLNNFNMASHPRTINTCMFFYSIIDVFFYFFLMFNSSPQRLFTNFLNELDCFSTFFKLFLMFLLFTSIQFQTSYIYYLACKKLSFLSSLDHVRVFRVK